MESFGQEAFKTCYRGRRGPLFHAAYMRMGKVLLARRVLRRTGLALERAEVFDYGFGAGTFYRYCPTSAHLSGVEQDPIVCREVSEMLVKRGFRSVELQPIEIEQWKEHPLLKREYDVFLCSHVFEHLPDPVDFLKTVRPRLKPDGVFLGLVPINERAENPHHLQKVDRAVVERWAADAAAISGRLLEAISFAAFASYRQEYEKRFERCAMVRNISAAMAACAVDSHELAG